MRIMVCYDDPDESREVLREAARHAQAFNAEVLLVISVIDNNRHYSEVVDFFFQLLREGKAFFDERAVSCTTHISYRGADMSVGEDLVNFARKEQADVIFLTIRGRSRIGKFLLGSVTQHVVLNADCPVVGVKKKNPSGRNAGISRDAALI